VQQQETLRSGRTLGLFSLDLDLASGRVIDLLEGDVGIIGTIGVVCRRERPKGESAGRALWERRAEHMRTF
jgi:hypothetical protein